MSSRRMDSLRLVGGALPLDFANTIDPRHDEPTEEYLDGYVALVEWGVHAGALDPALGRWLVRRARARPAQAERVLARALSLRDALYTVLAPGSVEAEREDALAVVNEELRRAWLHTRVEQDDGGFGLVADDELDRPLWAVAHATLELLLSPERARVKECARSGCGWLFLDTSKAGRRRWCSMEVCGNRAKAERFRARNRSGTAERRGARLKPPRGRSMK